MLVGVLGSDMDTMILPVWLARAGSGIMTYKIVYG